VPYVPSSAISVAQANLESFQGFADSDRENIAWKNAFELFPVLSAKFPEMLADSTS